MRDSFIMYTEYMDVLETLTPEKAGLLIRAMVRYARDEEPVLDDETVRAVFATIKPKMDKDREKWEAVCEKRRAAGKLGGRPKKAEKANGFSEKHNKACKPDSDSECDSEYINNNLSANDRTNAQCNAQEIFEQAWAMYPEKKGKARVSDKDKRTIAEIGLEHFTRALDRYKAEVEASSFKRYQNGSTFFHSGYVDYLDENYSPTTEKPRSGTHRFNNASERSYDSRELELSLLASN